MTYAINVDVIIRRGSDWILMVRGKNESHAAGKLSLVGGTVEAESPATDILESTARREVEEEIGIRVDGPLTYVHNTTFTTDEGELVLNVVFLAHIDSEVEPTIKSPEEVEDIAFFTLDNLKREQSCPPWTLDSVMRAEELL